MLDHRIEFVAVQHQQAATLARRVHAAAEHFDVLEPQPDERAHVVVVIAGDVDDPRSVLALLQQQPQHLGVRRRPMEAAAQAFEIDDVADEIQRVAARVAQKIEQQLHPAGPRTEMHVR